MIFVSGSLSVECVLDSGSVLWGGRDSLFASVQSLLSESRFSSGRALMACSVLVLREASAAAATPTAPTTTPVMRCGLTAPPLRLWSDFEAVETFSHLSALHKSPWEGCALSAWKERCASLLITSRWVGHLFLALDVNPTLLESQTRAASFDIWNAMVCLDSWQI